MINCPKCNQSLMDWVVTCQFCGADTKTIARPAPVVKERSRRAAKPAWIGAMYNAIAAYWIINGLVEIGQGFGLGAPKIAGASSINVIALVFGVATTLVGAGLIFHVEIARGIANFFSGLKIIFGLFGLAGSVIGLMFAGWLGMILVLMNVLDIVTGGLMLYLIGETETRMPNM